MDSVRRVGALVMGILVLQLSLGAGAAPCAESPTVAAAAAGHGGMSMPAESESCSRDGNRTDCTPSDHGACQTMISCVAIVLQAAAQSQLTVAVASDAAPADPAAQLQTRSTVPDLPPPRA